MREHLFRGKRKKDDKWAVGGFHKWETRQPCPFNDELSLDEVKYLIIGNTNADWNMPREICATEVDPETVGQYIGSVDKNKVRIFEGDILKAKVRCGRYYKNKIGCVVYDGLALQFVLKIQSENGYDYKPIPFANYCEVIGNIYDNPELLENSINTDSDEQ